jgi:ketosteroid isomerase-like protein
MNEIERVLIVHACERLVLDSAAFADSHRPEELANLFTKEAVLVRPVGLPLQGRAAIREAYATRPAERVTRHLVTNIRIDVESATHARGASYVLLWSCSTKDQAGPLGRPARQPAVVGEFHDVFRLGADGWRISSREAGFTLHAID